MRLSPNLSLNEFTFSHTATRWRISNKLPENLMGNAKRWAEEIFEPLREMLGNQPVYVTSGYRCPLLNKKINGSRNSAHMQALAGDLVCYNYGTPREIILKVLEEGLEFDQIIEEGGQWVHIAITENRNRYRNEVLEAMFYYDRATGRRKVSYKRLNL